MEVEMISKAPYMNKAEEYMKEHDFVRADVYKVRMWVKRVIGNRSNTVRSVTITRTHIKIENIYGSTCEIHRLSLGIQENFK